MRLTLERGGERRCTDPAAARALPGCPQRQSPARRLQSPAAQVRVRPREAHARGSRAGQRPAGAAGEALARNSPEPTRAALSSAPRSTPGPAPAPGAPAAAGAPGRNPIASVGQSAPRQLPGQRNRTRLADPRSALREDPCHTQTGTRVTSWKRADPAQCPRLQHRGLVNGDANTRSNLGDSHRHPQPLLMCPRAPPRQIPTWTLRRPGKLSVAAFGPLFVQGKSFTNDLLPDPGVPAIICRSRASTRLRWSRIRCSGAWFPITSRATTFATNTATQAST